MAQLKEGSVIKKSTGDEIIATINDIPNVPTKTSELENNSGFITSSAIPTSLPANGGNADTVGGFTVGVNVPANAKFTDTVYTHPVNHPPSIISQDANNRFVTDTEKATWNGKSNFSGSYNDLSNKPSLFSGNYNDLSNKPTIPDTSTLMPKSGGVLENYREKLVTLSGTSTSINLNNGNVFTHTLSGNTTYSISNAVSGQAHSFTLIITQTATVRTIAFPASVKWQGGEIPNMSIANKTYILTFVTVDGGTTWFGMFGGEF